MLDRKFFEKDVNFLALIGIRFISALNLSLEVYFMVLEVYLCYRI